MRFLGLAKAPSALVIYHIGKLVRLQSVVSTGLDYHMTKHNRKYTRGSLKHGKPRVSFDSNNHEQTIAKNIASSNQSAKDDDLSKFSPAP
eukprot:720693-Rhodomonas_salina.1